LKKNKFMGFFNKIFGGQEKPSNENQNIFHTNTFKYGLGKVQLTNSTQLSIDVILAMAEFEKIAKQQNQKFSYKVMYSHLIGENLLTVPLVFQINDEKYSVYFIYNRNDLAQFNNVKKHISKTQYPNLIYFSAIPVTIEVEPVSALAPIQLGHFLVDLQNKPKGTYAMWWATQEDPIFEESNTYTWLTGLYEVSNGYETYLNGFLLYSLGIDKGKNWQRISLPEKNHTFPLIGPENTSILLDVSQEKGIRFLFPVNKVSKSYVETILKGLVANFIVFVAQLKKSNLPMDEEKDPNGYDWFNFMSRVVKKEKISAQDTNDLQIGVVEYD